MNSRDYLWGDAQSRAASGLIALYAAHPHLAAIGFVWMPLPTLLELVPIALYPAWHEVVSSGFAASLITVLCGTLTAGIVFTTAQKLDLPTLAGGSLYPPGFLYADAVPLLHERHERGRRGAVPYRQRLLSCALLAYGPATLRGCVRHAPRPGLCLCL